MNMRIRRTADERAAASRLQDCRFKRDDCHAYKDGCCQALADTDFGDRDCPFYRSKEENVREVSACLNILIRKGRSDLIDKYRPIYISLNFLGGEDEFISSARKQIEIKRQEIRAQIKARKESVQQIEDEWYE